MLPLLFITIFFISDCVLGLPDQKSFGHGRYQSPVNVNLYNVRLKYYMPLFWSIDYFQVLHSLKITVTKETVKLEVNNTHAPSIGGGPLNDYYRLAQVHFHWGAIDSAGSEHTLGFKKFPMEMHAVHTKADLTLDEALLLPDGLLVIGYFIEPERDFQHFPSSSELVFKEITNAFPRISQEARETHINSRLTLVDLVVPFTHDYLTYKGSLTTPAYNEAVIWFLSPLVLKISKKQLQAFRDLHSRGLTEHSDNWRRTQPLNGRKIYRSTVPYHDFLDIHDQHHCCHYQNPDSSEENAIDSDYFINQP